MSMNISQKPQASVGFSAVPVKTYKAMLENQGLTEVINYEKGSMYVELNKHGESLTRSNGKMIFACKRTLGEAHKAIANKLNLNEVLKIFKSDTNAAIVTDKMPRNGFDFFK